MFTIESLKTNTRTRGIVTPPDLEGTVQTLYALSFGPLTRKTLLDVLRQAGLRMPDGSAITSPKVAPVVDRLRGRGVLTTESGMAPFCEPKARAGLLATARLKGWLLPLGEALKRTSPAELPADAWERRCGYRRFTSFASVCRDVFLALERDDRAELDRWAAICEGDPEVHSLIDVLLVVCDEPFDPELVERIPMRYRAVLFYAILHGATCKLVLNHPVFAFLRARILADPRWLAPDIMQLIVNHLVERDLLACDFAEARTLLETFAGLDTFLMRGMQEMLLGHLPAALQAFDQALQGIGKGKKKQLVYLQSFPALLHTLLLVQSDRPQDRQQARTWVNWVTNRRGETAYYHAYGWLNSLLRFYEGGGTITGLASFSVYRHHSPLECFAETLLWLVYCRYASQRVKSRKGRDETVTDVQRLLGDYKRDGARWAEMQMARLLDKLEVAPPAYRARAESFFRQSPACDLSELWTVKEIWQSQVDALEALIQTSKPVVAGSRDSTRRLGWRLCLGWGDDIQIVPVEQKRTKRGGWTKGRDVSLRRLIDPETAGLDYLTDLDRKALVAIGGNSRSYYHGYSYQIDTAWALEALAGHPNIFWEDQPGIPVEVSAGKPEVQIVPARDTLRITLAPYPVDVEYQESIRLIVQEAPARLRVVTFQPVHLRMAEILGPNGLVVPKDQAERTLERLHGLSKHIAIQSDVAVVGAEAETVEPDCRLHLRLQRFGQGLQADMVVLPLGPDSQRAFTPGVGNVHLIESVGGRALQTQRDLSAETGRAADVLQAVPTLHAYADGSYTWLFDEPTAALELLEQLQTLGPEQLTIEWPKGDPITVRPISIGQFQFSVRSAESWFEVEGAVKVDRDLMLTMQTLLDRIENDDSRFIALGKNQYVALTRQLRKQLEGLAASSQPARKNGVLRVHPLAAIALEQWRGDVGRFKADKTFDACIERFRAVESYHPDVASTLQATLRPYQQDGFVWLARLAEWGAGACLADDMGLGKTLEALALVLHRGAQGPTLVVAPTSVCANWVTEAQRFAPTLRPIRFGLGDHGRRDEILDRLQPFDLLICSYTILQQEADALKDVRFTTIVLDEAQAIKNAATKRSSAAMTLNGDFRMVCTGTPIENRLAELWNLFRFINPGLLGSEKRFQERFVRPIEMERDARARGALKALIQPFILRRTKSQVLEDLPPRTEVLRLVELSDEERALHESLRRRALERLEGLRGHEKAQARIQVLAELMKLRRCCCNPRLIVPDCGLTGAKLDAFAELVDELLDNRHKALVFSQFVDHLTLLREHLDARKIGYQYLDGSTPARARQRRINAFQKGEGDLFLISLKAGGLGLNLTAADYVIHMDPWWNPAVEDQASDRAHRIGQTRPVTVYRLVAADTIEEKIVQLHHAKRDLADSLLEGTDTAHTLTADELIDLLRRQ